MKALTREYAARIREYLEPEFAVAESEIQFTIPPNRRYGDLSTTLPFVLAKRMQKKPIEIGRRMVSILSGRFAPMAEVSLAGGGFLNFTLDRRHFLRYLLDTRERRPAARDKRIVVEHTSINPNKAAHIGHLRNACLGDTLARSLKYLGYPVEVQNYIDDTGIQVADVVWGLLHMLRMSPEEICRIDDPAALLWELYAKVSRHLSADPESEKARNRVHQAIEERREPEYGVADWISSRVLEDHIRVMASIGIRYDLLVRERDIIELDFFARAARIMEQKGILYASSDPEKQGCKVIHYRHEDLEKVVIRSNGTATYIAKDLAYTFWKVGRFSEEFPFREFCRYDDGRVVLTTDFRGGDETRDFGPAQRVFNVIDVRQSYLQNIIAQVLEDLDPDGAGGHPFVHFSYEMVALTPRCVRELELPLSAEDENKPWIEVSGRKGIAVKASDLIEQLTVRSREEVDKRNPDLDESSRQDIAVQIAVGALRYFMIKFNARAVIAFDFKDALAFEGDTGPYLQYTLVRLNSILRKLDREAETFVRTDTDPARLEPAESAEFFDLLLQLADGDNRIESALENQDLSGIANHAFALCQAFNRYYHGYPVVNEPDPMLRSLRIQLLLLVRERLGRLLWLMGIPVPTRM
ncbi:MAG: arginine--tRNA ligase [Acidobacteriota bacterium]|jgi:arginyl-tRNA synthetase|nr:arginine--tRNA ligase [Acidobacteriota bacterium]